MNEKIYTYCFVAALAIVFVVGWLAIGWWGGEGE